MTKNDFAGVLPVLVTTALLAGCGPVAGDLPAERHGIVQIIQMPQGVTCYQIAQSYGTAMSCLRLDPVPDTIPTPAEPDA